MSKKKKLPFPYVSRGGLKLEHALKTFNVPVKDKIAIDVGASTGGFTDCLLSFGAKKVYSIDVSYGQLAWKLQKDPRVVIVDRTNARALTSEKLYKEGDKKADVAVVDVSFISLSKILPAVYDLLSEDGIVISLVKPQFEAKREQVKPGGLVKEKEIHKEVLRSVYEQAKSLGFKFFGCTYSPITGAAGNIEYFLYLGKKDGKEPGGEFEKAVDEAHQKLET